MTAATLLLGALLNVGVAAIYLTVGRAVAKRPVQGDAKLANRLFSFWWYALAAITAVGPLQSILAAAGALDVAFARALRDVAIFALFVGLFALTYYLAFLFLGSSRPLLPLALYFGVGLLATAWLVEAAGATTLEVGAWRARLVAEHPVTGWPAIALTVGILGPVVLGAAGYASLYLRADSPEMRYRIALVSGSFIVWFGLSILASLAKLSTLPVWPVVSTTVGLAAALAVLAAYRPPAFVRRRLAPASPPPEPDEDAGTRGGTATAK